MKTNRLKYMTQLLTIALVALCVPASLCQASVEPELTMAIRQKNVAKVQQLLASGANIDERDESAEQTPLMRAVQVKDVGLVQILLAHGASVNVQDDFGKTALMFATENDDAEIIKALLRRGADASLRDARAVSAADIARGHGHARIFGLPAQSRMIANPKRGKPDGNRTLALK
jgi:ankyrin repeat protein